MCDFFFLLETKDDESFSAAQQFYKDLGDIAVEKGYAVRNGRIVDLC